MVIHLAPYQDRQLSIFLEELLTVFLNIRRMFTDGAGCIICALGFIVRLSRICFYRIKLLKNVLDIDDWFLFIIIENFNEVVMNIQCNNLCNR